MTNDDGRKPEGAPERSPKAGAGAPSDVEGNGPKRFSVIPAPFDQNPCAHWRRPMDMILQGWSTSLFQASQQWSTRSS
jgi:hypothetical protein